MKQPAISSLFQSQKHYDESHKNEFSLPQPSFKLSQDAKKVSGNAPLLKAPVELSLSGSATAPSTSVGTKIDKRKVCKISDKTKEEQPEDECFLKKPNGKARKDSASPNNGNNTPVTALRHQFLQKRVHAALDKGDALGKRRQANLNETQKYANEQYDPCGTVSTASYLTETNKTIAQVKPRNRKRQAKDLTKDQNFLHFAEKAPVSKKCLPQQDQLKQTVETPKQEKGGLSATTQDLLKRMRQKQNVKRSSSKSPSRLEEEIPFDKLPQSQSSSVLGSKSKDAEMAPVAKPVQLPQSATTSNPLSSETLNLLNKLRKQGKQNHDSSARVGLSRGLFTQSINQPKESMREKHEDLLKVKRELVLPVHMKHLIEGCQFIDETLNFIKRCRRSAEGGAITFKEVKTSIEKSYARTVTVSHFRQLLSVVPEFYIHSWEKLAGSNEHQLVIDFKNDSNSTKLRDFFVERKRLLKERLIQICITHYKTFMEPQLCTLSSEWQDLVSDPLKYQQWHHSFDPHVQIPKVKEADLAPPPKQMKSPNVQTFLNGFQLNSTNVESSIIKQAMLSAKSNESNQLLDQPEDSQKIETEKQRKLEALSKSSGLSIDTLKLIQASEKKVNARNECKQQMLAQQESKSRFQSLNQLANQIRNIMLYQQKTAMLMSELIDKLSERQQGAFISKNERQDLIMELQKAVPRWIKVVDHTERGRVVGKIVKTASKSVNAAIVSKTIQEYLNSKEASE